MENLPDEFPETEAPPPSAMSVIVDAIGAFLGHIPAALKRNVFKAFNHMLKVPNAYLDGWADEVRATSDARIQITKATGKALAKAVEVDSALALTATHTHASKILRQQTNAVKVLQHAAEEIKSTPPSDDTATPDISEDWLNAFEAEAINMSSEQMQKLFGKILAGEMRKPSTYSIRTVRLLAQLDNDVAESFRMFCSMASVLQVGGRVVEAQMLTLGSNDSRTLGTYGITYSRLHPLIEYGLVFSTDTVSLPYEVCIPEGGAGPLIALRYCGKDYFLLRLPEQDQRDFTNFLQSGVGLTRAGKELSNIVELAENPEYTRALQTHLAKAGLKMTPVSECLDIKVPKSRFQK
ncbi:DUF2806 domain-containing protein [Massilia sp. PAMC28688]|uniref:DUF2806 domain-containing protein n=1 Tax=Massilia sp. PAMC28688 TaxID=2861283 RepID=UPI001C62FCAF|nr:DUF2806 domain-containing protein [Massilia sp. PAMC28688]QYF93566.1 DUF2806 domain-containing protein [Massilia sp. PAMC28688]